MLRPRLRDGLNFSVQEQGGERVCVIEDPASSRFYRVGTEEYHFFRSLDGRQTVASIIARRARDRSGETFTEQEALQMLRWLKDNHLLALESERATGEAEGSRRAWKGAVQWMNPLLVRIPLGRPDRFFAWAARLFRPVLGWFGFAIWIAVIFFGASRVGMEWGRFSRGFTGIIARDNWLWLGLVWIGLKILHECGHGIFCRHFGTRVREVGVMFILLMPMGYVDATASLGLASKWRRIIVACAGMYVEIFIAAIAAIAWAGTADGRAATVLHNAIVMGTAVTIFFNANPLMRFDGYFILSDLLGISNLATRARSWFMSAATWLLLGAKKLRPERLETREDWLVAIYGVAAWVWQIVVVAGCLLAASVMFRGGGLLISVLASVAWIGVPLVMFVKQIRDSLHRGMGSMLHVALRLAVVFGLVWLVFFSPYRKTVVARGVVEFGDTRILRAECPGFVERLHVKNGDVVETGALLVELRNEEAASALMKARRELDAQELRARVAYARGTVSEYQAAYARAEGLHKTVRENESYLATLQIRAPIAGQVSARKLDQVEGSYFQRGDEILKIGEADVREVKLAIRQDAAPHFKAALEGAVSVRVDGRGDVLSARLEHLDGNASRTLPHPALTALAGGPIAVQAAGGDAAPRTQGEERYELAEPHIGATVRVTSKMASALDDGELARVRFRSPVRVTLWSEARAAIERWMRKYGA